MGPDQRKQIWIPFVVNLRKKHSQVTELLAEQGLARGEKRFKSQINDVRKLPPTHYGGWVPTNTSTASSNALKPILTQWTLGLDRDSGFDRWLSRRT